MIRLHATNKLLAKLPLASNGTLTGQVGTGFSAAKTLEALNPLSDWQGSLVVIQKRNCVLLRHEQTGFVLCLANLQKSDFAHFDRHFKVAVQGALRCAKASDEHLQTLTQLLQPLVVDERYQPQEVERLNQLKATIERCLWDDNASLETLDIDQLNVQVNAELSTLSQDKPLQAMLDLLEHAARSFARSANDIEQTAGAKAQHNVVHFADFRAPKIPK